MMCANELELHISIIHQLLRLPSLSLASSACPRTSSMWKAAPSRMGIRSAPLAVLTTKLIHSMCRDRLTRGLVTLCIEGGQGIALALEVLH